MKKLKLAKSFLLVGKILGIIAVVTCGVMILTSIVLTVVGASLVDPAQIEAVLENEPTFEEFLAAFGPGSLLVIGIIFLIAFGIGLPFAIASLVLVSIARRKAKVMSSKKEATPVIVLSFIAGGLGLTFPIVSAIVLCTSKDADYKVIEAK